MPLGLISFFLLIKKKVNFIFLGTIEYGGFLWKLRPDFFSPFLSDN